MTNQSTEERKDRRTEEPKNPKTFFSSSVLQFFRPSNGLTLIELMVSAVILAIGLVLVARGLMTASSALQAVDNRMEAFKFLDAKLTELRQQAREGGGLAPERETGTTQLNHRAAAWLVEIEPVDLEGAGGIPQEEAGGGAAPPRSEVAIAQVRLSVSWQETRRQQEAVLVTYIGEKAAPVGDQPG